MIHLLLFLAFVKRGRLLVGTVALVYLCSLTPLVWRDERATIVLACVLLTLVAGLGSGPARPALARAAQSCLVVT